MAENVTKLRGKLKTANPGVGNGDVKMYPILATVKDNIDPNHSGRIRVLLGDKPPNDPEDSSSWVTVSYLSSFGGTTGASGGNTGTGSYKSNPSSFGQTNSPPDIGSKVVVIFINGDVNYGYYLGVAHDPEAMHSIPSIGTSDNVVPNSGEAKSLGGSTRLPVTNMNTNDPSTTDSSEFNSTPRPVHSYSAAIHTQQGTVRDTVRGPKSSSASRESPSRVGWGVNSPGRPIYSGGYDDSTLPQNLATANPQQLQVVSRRTGHSITMDDGDTVGKDQGIHIRTSLGHQLMMSDDGQTLMLLHSNGQSYIELGKEGTVDIFTTNSVNMRTQGDINLHADRDVNIQAMENFKVQAKNIQFNSDEKTKFRSGQDFLITSLQKLTAKVTGAVAFSSGAEASLVGGGDTFINGSKVNLNSGSPSTTPEEVPIIPLNAQTDTLHDPNVGFAAAPGKLLTIASRAPAHAPWANAGQGVDVKNSMDAGSNLPSSPNPSVQQTNQAALSGGGQGGTAGAAGATPALAGDPPAATPPNIATIASAPSVTAISDAIDADTTDAMIASVATVAATGPLSSAATLGATVVSTDTGNIAAVGSFALTPSQLASAGIIKPGSDTLINSLVNSGANIDQAMPSSLFTGTPGAEDLASLAANPTAQATAVVTTMQQAQTALGMTGVISGNESATQVAGLVQAGSTVGIDATMAAIQQVTGQTGTALASVTGASSALSGVSNALSGSAGSLTGTASAAVNSSAGAIYGAVDQVQSALSAIGSGGAAATFASTATGGLGGIASALTAMGGSPDLSSLLSTVDGVAASAFNAIVDSFTPLEANVPQNLSAIAKAKAASNATRANQSTQLGGSLLSGLAGGSLTGAINSVISGTSGLGSISGSTQNILGSLSSVAGGITGLNTGSISPSSLASNLGSVNAAQGLINNSVGGITGSVSKITNALSSAARSTGLSSSIVTSTIGGITAIANTVSGNVTARSTISSPLNPAIGGITSAVNAISSLAGSASVNPSDYNALSSAASVIQQGSSASLSAAAASGVSNLPGGINTVASVLNQAKGALNSIPGTSQLTGLINQVQSSVMGATNAINGVSSIVSSLQGQANGLTALASAGLPVGAIAQLQSALSSIPGGTSSIVMPSIGFNTTDRSSVTAQIGNILGDPSIPAPSLIGEIPDSAEDAYQQIVDAADSAYQIQDQVSQHEDSIQNALDAYYTAEQNLPEGDPGIDQAYQTYLNLVNDPEYTSLLSELDGLTNDVNAVDASSTASATASDSTQAISSSDGSILNAVTGPQIGAVNSSLAGAFSIAGGLSGGASIGTAASGSIAGVTNSLGGSINSTVSDLSSLASDASLSILNQNASGINANANQTISTVTSDSLIALQAQAATNETDLNNSLTGITGPTTLIPPDITTA